MGGDVVDGDRARQLPPQKTSSSWNDGSSASRTGGSSRTEAKVHGSCEFYKFWLERTIEKIFCAQLRWQLDD